MRIECKSCEASLDVPYQKVLKNAIVVCPLCDQRYLVSKALIVRYLGGLLPVLSDGAQPITMRAWLSLKYLELTPADTATVVRELDFATPVK